MAELVAHHREQVHARGGVAGVGDRPPVPAGGGGIKPAVAPKAGPATSGASTVAPGMKPAARVTPETAAARRTPRRCRRAGAGPPRPDSWTPDDERAE